MDTLEIIFVTLAAVLLVGLARLVLEWISGKSLQLMLTTDDNTAMGIVVTGYLFSVLWTVSVLLSTLSYELIPDVLQVLLYGALGIVLLTLTALGTCRLLLGMPVQEQLASHNVAAAIVVAAAYVATGFTYSGGLTGQGGGFWIMLLFFVLGQLALLGITYLFRWLTSYNDVQEIAAGNSAVAVALAGLLLAVGLLVSRAVSGDYTGLAHSLGSFLLALLFVIALYPVRQIIVQYLLLGGPLHWRATVLDSEIAQDKNVAIGLLEATAYLATAIFITHIV